MQGAPSLNLLREEGWLGHFSVGQELELKLNHVSQNYSPICSSPAFPSPRPLGGWGEWIIYNDVGDYLMPPVYSIPVDLLWTPRPSSPAYRELRSQGKVLDLPQPLSHTPATSSLHTGPLIHIPHLGSQPRLHTPQTQGLDWILMRGTGGDLALIMEVEVTGSAWELVCFGNMKPKACTLISPMLCF